jgi:hypothetical protein
VSLYAHGQCRCETCTAAVSANRKKYYAENGEATRKRNNQYRAEHRETVNERGRRYHAEHRESLLQQMKLRYANDSDAYVERVRQWRLVNPDRYREQTRKKNHLRRARINATKVVDFTQEQLEQKMAYYGNACYLQIPGICTGEFDHVDHREAAFKRRRSHDRQRAARVQTMQSAEER